MSELTNLVAKQNEESYQLGKKHGAIEELEHLKAVIRFNGLYNEQIEDLIDIEIKGWKGENNEHNN